MINWTISQTVDLQRPASHNHINYKHPLMLEGDKNAHVWKITVLVGGKPTDLSGYTLMGYMCRSDGSTVVIPNGTIEGNVCSIALSGACYAVGGEARGIVRLVTTTKTVTIATGAFYIKRGTTDDMVIDAGTPMPTYEQLIADVEATAAALNVERARITALANLGEGSTTGDAELTDLRTDSFGNTFTNAGDAARGNQYLLRKDVEGVMKVVYLPVDCLKTLGMGFAINNSGQAILMARDTASLYSGVIDKTGVYNLAVSTLLSRHELNESTYVDYIYYDTEERQNVFIEAGTYFYVLGGNGSAPCIRTTYIPEQIVVDVSPDETIYRITEGDEVTPSITLEGLLEDGMIRLNSDRYNIIGYQVMQGGMYRLRSEKFEYPADVYQLFGFAKAAVYQKNPPYIKSGIRTDEGAIDIIMRSPIDGYLWISEDSQTPANFSVVNVTAISRANNVKRKSQPYHKLLTIGDSLSGNANLWQPKATELLDISDYGILGGAGLTITDQGADVNTIYNRVMAMTKDSAVDLITFWGGYNDFSRAVALSTLEEQLNPETRDASTFYGGVLDCVEKILSVYPLKQLVMIGTTPFHVGVSWQTKTNGKGLKIEDYVTAFRTVAEYYSIPFLDLLHTSGFNSYNYPTYYLDQTYWLHPNSMGNALLGHKIAGFIKGLNGAF